MTKKKKTFRSKLEQSVAEILDQVGAKYEYETHKVAYTIQHHYNPDFCLINGVMLETKGYWDAEDRRKIKAVMRDNPDIDLRMVFQAPFNTGHLLYSNQTHYTYRHIHTKYKNLVERKQNLVLSREKTPS